MDLDKKITKVLNSLNSMNDKEFQTLKKELRFLKKDLKFIDKLKSKVNSENTKNNLDKLKIEIESAFNELKLINDYLNKEKYIFDKITEIYDLIKKGVMGRDNAHKYISLLFENNRKLSKEINNPKFSLKALYSLNIQLKYRLEAKRISKFVEKFNKLFGKISKEHKMIVSLTNSFNKLIYEYFLKKSLVFQH